MKKIMLICFLFILNILIISSIVCSSSYNYKNYDNTITCSVKENFFDSQIICLNEECSINIIKKSKKHGILYDLINQIPLIYNERNKQISFPTNYINNNFLNDICIENFKKLKNIESSNKILFYNVIPYSNENENNLLKSYNILGSYKDDYFDCTYYNYTIKQNIEGWILYTTTTHKKEYCYDRIFYKKEFIEEPINNKISIGDYNKISHIKLFFYLLNKDNKTITTYFIIILYLILLSLILILIFFIFNLFKRKKLKSFFLFNKNFFIYYLLLSFLILIIFIIYSLSRNYIFNFTILNYTIIYILLKIIPYLFLIYFFISLTFYIYQKKYNNNNNNNNNKLKKNKKTKIKA